MKINKYDDYQIIKRHLLLLCLYIRYIIVLGIYYACVNIYGTIYYFY
jgi:hypothetical protein